MNKWVELLVGLALIILAVLVAFNSSAWFSPSWNFLSAAKTVFMGGLFWFVVGIGALFILLGVSDLKG